MIGDQLASEDVLDDSPWRADADVEFEHPAPIPFAGPPRPTGRSWADHRTAVADAAVDAPEPDRPGDERSDAPPSRRRRRGPAIAVASVVVIAAIAVARPSAPSIGGSIVEPESTQQLLVDTGGDRTLAPGDAPLVSRVAALHEPRLPRTAGELWTFDLEAAGEPSVVALADTIAVVADTADTADSDGWTLAALDPADGVVRWSVAVDAPAAAIEVVGGADDVIVTTVRELDGVTQLIGYDAASGDELWARRLDAGAETFVDRGSETLVVQYPPIEATADVGRVEQLGARTGVVELVVDGSYLGVVEGDWLATRAGDKVLIAAMSPDVGSPAREMLGAVTPGDAPFTLVERSLLVSDGATSLTRSSLVVSSTSDRDVRSIDVVGAGRITAPSSVQAISPIGESAVLITGNGSVHGANVGGETAEIRWRVNGLALADARTDRGRSILLSTRGGAAQRVIDASNGRTVVELSMQPGALQTLRMVANGVVVRAIVDGDVVRRAVDLNGRELWTIPGTGPLAVGQGVVVDVGSVPDTEGSTSWRLAGYGDTDAQGFVMNAGVERHPRHGTWHRS